MKKKQRFNVVQFISENAGIKAKYYKDLKNLIDKLISLYFPRLISASKKNNYEDYIYLLNNIVSNNEEKCNKFFKRNAEAIAISLLFMSIKDVDTRFVNRLNKALTRKSITEEKGKINENIIYSPKKELEKRLETSTKEIEDYKKTMMAQNVSLIKSIPKQFHDRVRFAVTSYCNGDSTGSEFVSDLRRIGHITYKRARFIADDQTNKINAGLQIRRAKALGLTFARWKHTAGQRFPRPSHVKAGASGLVFDTRRGASIDGKWIRPGELINCKCRPEFIIPDMTMTNEDLEKLCQKK